MSNGLLDQALSIRQKPQSRGGGVLRAVQFLASHGFSEEIALIALVGIRTLSTTVIYWRKAMVLFEFRLSGTKEQAYQQLRGQVKDPEARALLENLVLMAPGSCVSMSGTLSGTEDESHGTLSMSGSFWTSK